MSSLRSEEGSMLVDLLVATVIMLIVIGATLNALDTFGSTATRNGKYVDAAEQARSAMDAIARQARNATAYQTSSSAGGVSILRADPADFVFKAVDPNSAPSSSNTFSVQTLRYCLKTSTGELWRQRRADSAMPAAACPDAAWTTKDVLATDVTNGTRPVFTYDSSTLASITSIGMHLFVDTSGGRNPAETSLNSGVFLRNQNRRPGASFTAITSTGNHVQLNGSSSTDPEGGLLNYEWKDGTTVLPQTGPVVDYVAPSSGPRTFTLTVTDAGGLDDATTQTVTVQ